MPITWWFKILGSLGLIVSALANTTGYLACSPFFAPITGLGVCLVIIGGIANLLHYRLLKQRATNIAEPGALITDALAYRYLRHPMYLGDIVVGTGFFLIWPCMLSLAFWLILVRAAVAQAIHEDRELADAFPSTFPLWRQRTGLMLPRLGQRNIGNQGHAS